MATTAKTTRKPTTRSAKALARQAAAPRRTQLQKSAETLRDHPHLLIAGGLLIGVAAGVIMSRTYSPEQMKRLGALSKDVGKGLLATAAVGTVLDTVSSLQDRIPSRSQAMKRFKRMTKGPIKQLRTAPDRQREALPF